MSKIYEIHGRKIWDFAGNPALEVEAVLESGMVGTAQVALPCCTGAVRAADERLQQKVTQIEESVSPELSGLDAIDQIEIDRTLEEMFPGREECNPVLWCVSLACAKAAAEFEELPLFRYSGGVHARTLPVPVIPVSPEIALSPAGAENFSDALLMVSSVADALKNVPAAENPVLSAIAQAGFQAGKDLFLTPLDGTLENSFPENVRDSVCQNAEILCPGGESVTALFDKAEKIRASGRFILLAEKTGALADAALADLAVALHAARIRADGSGGIVCFNRLLQMEEMLGGQRRYGA